ncbi:Anaphase promoting complex subunit 7, partial [Coemansia erecta]
MTATQLLTQEIQQLLNCDLGESALQLAELECKPRLTDRRLSPSERLGLLRAYSACLDAQKQHRTSLRVITEFISGPERGQLTADELEEVARDIAAQRWRLGEHDLCLAQLRQIPRTHRTTADVARMARCAGLIRSPDAAELFGELLKRQPNASEALAYVGKVHPAEGYHDVASLATARRLAQNLDYRGAVDELSRLARRHPGSAPVRAYQATCRYMMNDVSAALALYERARTLEPGLMDQMGAYATLLASSTGDAHAVYRLGNELLKVDQGRAEGWVAMARYFLLSGETQEALAIAWRAQTLAPSYACAYYTEGVIQLASGSVDDALDVFIKAHQLERSALTFRAV